MTTTGVAFLLGTPRSGTTLLSALLNQHPEIICPPEPWLLLGLAEFGRVHPSAACGPRLLQQALDGFLPGAAFDDTMRTWAESSYGARCMTAGRRLFIDKTPRYYLILDKLTRWFPDAPRIILLRHPLDVALSMARTWDVDLAHVIDRQMDHRLANDFILGHARLAELCRQGGPRTVVIRYEDLLQDAGRTLGPVWTALGLAPHVINPLQTNDPGNPALTGVMGDRNIRREAGIHLRSIGRWRDDFAPGDASLLARALGRETFERLGYGKEVAGIEWDGGRNLVSRYEGFTAHRLQQTISPDDEVTPAERTQMRRPPVSKTIRKFLRRMLSGTADAPPALARVRRPASVILLGSGDAEVDTSACQRMLAALPAGGRCLLIAGAASADVPDAVERSGWSRLASLAQHDPHQSFLLIAAGDEITPGTLAWLSSGSAPVDAVIIGRAAWGGASGLTSTNSPFARNSADLGPLPVPVRGLAAGGKPLAAAIHTALRADLTDGMGWRVLFELLSSRCTVVDRTLAVLDVRRAPACWAPAAHTPAWEAFQYTRTLRAGRRHVGDHITWPTADLAEPPMWKPVQPSAPAYGGNIIALRRQGVETQTWLHDPITGHAGIATLTRSSTTSQADESTAAQPRPVSAACTWIRQRLQPAHGNGPMLLIGPDTHVLATDDASDFRKLPADAWNLPATMSVVHPAGACWLGQAFEEAEDGTALLRRIGTLLVPGGQLFLHVLNLSTALRQGSGSPAWHVPARRRMVSPTWMRQTAAQCGFDFVALATHDVDDPSRHDEDGDWLLAEWKRA